MSEIVRFLRDGCGQYGVHVSAVIHELDGDVYGDFDIGPAIHPQREVEILAPCQPTKIIGVGWNYKHLSVETQERPASGPVFFLKPPSAVIGPDAAIVLPQLCDQVFFEAELAVVIKQRARHICAADYQQYVLGYTCGNDVTARMADGMRILGARAKSFDTFCPLGPLLAAKPEFGEFMIRSWINGRLCQESSTAEMIVSVPELISRISGIMTLEPGDVILTGTPPGASAIQPGDEITVEIEGIGTLTNQAVAENKDKCNQSAS